MLIICEKKYALHFKMPSFKSVRLVVIAQYHTIWRTNFMDDFERFVDEICPQLDGLPKGKQTNKQT